MTSHRKSNAETLLRLSDALVEDVLASSDDEILADVTGVHDNPQKAGREVREIIGRALRMHGDADLVRQPGSAGGTALCALGGNQLTKGGASGRWSAWPFSGRLPDRGPAVRGGAMAGQVGGFRLAADDGQAHTPIRAPDAASSGRDGPEEIDFVEVGQEKITFLHRGDETYVRFTPTVIATELRLGAGRHALRSEGRAGLYEVTGLTPEDAETFIVHHKADPAKHPLTWQ